MAGEVCTAVLGGWNSPLNTGIFRMWLAPRSYVFPFYWPVPPCRNRSYPSSVPSFWKITLIVCRNKQPLCVLDQKDTATQTVVPLLSPVLLSVISSLASTGPINRKSDTQITLSVFPVLAASVQSDLSLFSPALKYTSKEWGQNSCISVLGAGTALCCCWAHVYINNNDT